MNVFKIFNNRKRIVFIFFSFVLLLLVFEGSLRLYFTIHYGAAFFNPSKMIMRTYSEVTKIHDSLDESSIEFSILLLGASVLHERFGHIPSLLEKKLLSNGVKKFRVYNASEIAHTTLDSYYKYKILHKKTFDVIVIYHGINELRANNCPSELFKPDYSHYAWYELRNLDNRHADTMNITVIPYSLDLLFFSLKQYIFSPQYVPFHSTLKDWIQYGAQIKTAVPFKNNIEKIIHASTNKNEIPIIMTYAYYVPDNYSYDAFKSRSLDYSYTDYSYPVKLWGNAPNVVKGLQEHNSAVRELVGVNPFVEYIDMEKTIPKEGTYFADICHLSEQGSNLFAETLANKITKIYNRKEIKQ